VAVDAVDSTISYLKNHWQINTPELVQLENRKLKQLLKYIPYHEPKHENKEKK
jgi:hypothetical protein